MATSHEGKVLQHTRHGLRMVGDKASLFDLSEPVWHPDEKSTECDICKTKFTFTNRRHHCRRCGDVICSGCSEKQPLRRMGFIDPVLICKSCVQPCLTEDDFYKNHLKILENGAYFQLSDVEGGIYNCKLSGDHFRIIITALGNASKHSPLLMSSIMEIKNITSGGHSPEVSGRKLSGLQLTYKENEHEKVVTFTASPSHAHKQSIDWLKALRKGLMILHSKEKRTLSLSESLP